MSTEEKIPASAWQHHLDKLALAQERICELEESLAKLEKRIVAIETMLSQDDSNPFYPESGRDDTHTLYTSNEE